MSPLKLIGGVAVEKKTSRLKRLQKRFIVCGLTPIMLLFFIFSVVPIIFSIVMSFYNYNGFPGAPFVGLANYKMLFQDPEFLGALKNTVVFVLVAVVLNICISTFLAVLIKSLRKKGARSFFRGWMFLPAVVPIVAVCYVWLIMFDPANGVLNQALMALGMDHPINWLNDPRTALFSIVLVTLWCDLGYNLVILMSGLDNIPKLNILNSMSALIIPFMVSGFGIFLCRQFAESIPNDILEAARIDGAGEWRIFFGIVIHTIKPAIAALCIFIFMGRWNDYLWPLIAIVDEDKMTLPLALNFFNSSLLTDYCTSMSAGVLVMIPIIIIYFIFQKQFIEGITMTGIK